LAVLANRASSFAQRSAAAAEYLAQFRTEVETLLTIEAVEACIREGALERPYSPHHNYVAYTDLSGGSSDSATIAIGHREDRTAVIDAIREVRPPFSREATIGEFAELLKTYGLQRTADGGLWPRERWAVHGIGYEVADKPKSQLYLSLVSAVNSGSAVLPDHPRLKAQLVGLERRNIRARARTSIIRPVLTTIWPTSPQASSSAFSTSLRAIAGRSGPPTKKLPRTPGPAVSSPMMPLRPAAAPCRYARWGGQKSSPTRTVRQRQ
jgi:hypothetical protein